MPRPVIPILAGAIALALVATLGGCDISTFAQPPLAEAACDARLVGHWLQATQPRDGDGTMDIRIDSSCRVVLTGRDEDGMHLVGPLALHVGHDAGNDYAWIDTADLPPEATGAQAASAAASATPNAASPTSSPAVTANASSSAPTAASTAPSASIPSKPDEARTKDYLLLRYRVDAKGLRFFEVDADATARRLLGAPVAATITRHVYGIDDHRSIARTSVRIDGALTPEQFRATIVFSVTPTYQFRAAPAESTAEAAP
ncbi:MAG: hypothetical protein JSR26_09210 [Proteobacteria bacterium]|nr:hypothetical protein [Pseudomonadota bacterium]